LGTDYRRSSVILTNSFYASLWSEEGLLMKALVSDDNADVAQLFAALLTHCGHEVQTASEADSAFESAKSHKPEIIFLDIGLPGMDGYLLARRLRDEPSIDGVKIIALSGHMVDERRFKESGINNFLLKPVGMMTLKEVIGC
jgi:CheY-like chemotaxis protein